MFKLKFSAWGERGHFGSAQSCCKQPTKAYRRLMTVRAFYPHFTLYNISADDNHEESSI